MFSYLAKIVFMGTLYMLNCTVGKDFIIYFILIGAYENSIYFPYFLV